MKITENTEIVKNTNGGKIRYHAKITGSKKMTKPYTKNYAASMCKDFQSDIDNGLLKLPVNRRAENDNNRRNERSHCNSREQTPDKSNKTI